MARRMGLFTNQGSSRLSFMKVITRGAGRPKSFRKSGVQSHSFPASQSPYFAAKSTTAMSLVKLR
jgi:hypothetical protein